jgi:hypothetical protein
MVVREKIATAEAWPKQINSLVAALGLPFSRLDEGYDDIRNAPGRDLSSDIFIGAYHDCDKGFEKRG